MDICERFALWLEGVFEDDALPYGINVIDFFVINKYPRVELGFCASQDGYMPLYYPLEAQSFFDKEFFNLNINDVNMINLVKKMINYAFSKVEVRQYINTKITIRGKINSKSGYFIVKHI